MKKILMLVMAAMLLFSAAGCKKEEVVTPSEPGTPSEVSEPVSTFDTSKEIKVISREEGSGTRGAFIELFGIEEKDADGNKVDTQEVTPDDKGNWTYSFKNLPKFKAGK